MAEDIKDRARVIVANGGWGDGRLLTFAEDVHEALSDGVAYMPVPRCGTCGHWFNDGSLDQGRGACRVTSTKIVVNGGAWWRLETDKDFGCNEWKAKS